MAAILATGQFSVRRTIDGRTLSFTLSSNLGSSQIESKDPKTYNPDYITNNLTITPVLLVSGAGSTANQITSACRWFIGDDALQGSTGAANLAKWGATVGAVAPFALKIAKNMTAVSQMTIRAEFDYTDPVTRVSVMAQHQTTITKSENAGTSIFAQIDTPDGDTFYTTAGAVQDLRLGGRMIRGADDDTTDVTYKWSIRTGGNAYPITSTTAPAGSGLPTGTLFAGAGTKTLTVKSTAVINTAAFQLDVTDTDPASTTFNKTASYTVTLKDFTDPYQVIIEQLQGDAISGSATVSATFSVMQNGVFLADSFYNNKSLEFFRYTAAGATDAAWIPSPSFTGWTVTTGVVSRTYGAGAGTKANRTVVIAGTHIPTNAAQAVFGVSLKA